MAAIFKDLFDSDSGTIWFRRVGLQRYHVMEVMIWEQVVSEGEAKEIGAKYNIDLSEVDLLELPLSDLASALDSCGMVEGFYQLSNRIREIERELRKAMNEKKSPFELTKLEETLAPEYQKLVAERNKLVQKTLKENELEVLYSVHSYGHKAPLFNENGDNLRELKKMARKVSAELDDPCKYEEAMNKPVNKIGSTAREFMHGDLNAALHRNTNDPSIRLMRKIHGLPEECKQEIPARANISAQINLQKIPSDDPIAYMMGYMHALSGNGIDEPREELAEAYIEGYQFGVTVKKGDAAVPAWHVG